MEENRKLCTESQFERAKKARELYYSAWDSIIERL
jgi:hypothetical protein